jgi:hypothetical protein
MSFGSVLLDVPQGQCLRLQSPTLPGAELSATEDLVLQACDHSMGAARAKIAGLIDMIKKPWRCVMQILKKLSWLSCLVLVLGVMTNEAFAQRGGRGSLTRTRFELATLPEVQAELKLSDEQKKIATDLLAKQREKLQAIPRGGDFQAMRAEFLKINSELEAEFTPKLDETQQARMNGLLAQVNGAVSLLDPAIAGAIEVTDEQLAKLKSVNDANRAARREAFQSFQNLSDEGRQEAIKMMTEKENKALLAVLSDDQKKKYEELKGAELKIDQSPLRQGRG